MVLKVQEDTGDHKSGSVFKEYLEITILCSESGS
jgi:hypothetical protein